MDRAAAVSRIQMYLGFRSDLETEIINALLDSQVELEKEAELPWFLESDEEAVGPTVDGTQVYPVPTGFIRQHEDGALYYYDASADPDEQWTELERYTNAPLRRAYQSSEGVPAAWELIGEEIRIYPMPDDAYTLKLTRVYMKDAVLTTNIENKWLQHAQDILIGKAGQKIAQAVRDGGALQTFVQMEALGRSTLDKLTVAREEHGITRQMGGRD